MHIKLFYYSEIIICCVILYLILFSNCTNVTISDKNCREISDYPQIDPDYTEVVIPPNIAPINFIIKEDAPLYYVEIYSIRDDKIKIKSNTSRIQIPIKSWKKLLENNKGGYIFIDIYVKDEIGNWRKYKTVKNRVAEENIDSYVVYRLINPAYVFWHEMGIYQRNIENFKETAVFTNRVTKMNCMNCHSFCQNNPDLMLFHMRASFSGTILYKNDSVKKLNTKTKYTMSAGVYPSWHPGGNHIAFSINKIYQKFHGNTGENLYVYDTHSDLVIYDINKNMITTSPKVSTERLENLPNWSPDGKYLYFCSAPFFNKMSYNEIQYDLMRISYDLENNTWGEVEKILTADETGRSISFPKVSPDGRFILFCLSEYGYFTIHFESSDLYLMDLESDKYYKLDVNTHSTESYHSWSSNSRWFVFVSKRRDGLCSRLYFSYIDENGRAYKPFLLPQKDPEFYDTFMLNYNLPELIKGPVKIDPWKLTEAAYSVPVDAEFDSGVEMDALSGASRIEK
jgi:hypothetical protein